MSFFDKMKDAGEDIKDAFAEGAHDLAEKAGEIKDAAADKAGDIQLRLLVECIPHMGQLR